MDRKSQAKKGKMLFLKFKPIFVKEISFACPDCAKTTLISGHAVIKNFKLLSNMEKYAVNKVKSSIK